MEGGAFAIEQVDLAGGEGIESEGLNCATEKISALPRRFKPAEFEIKLERIKNGQSMPPLPMSSPQRTYSLAGGYSSNASPLHPAEGHPDPGSNKMPICTARRHRAVSQKAARRENRARRPLSSGMAAPPDCLSRNRRRFRHSPVPKQDRGAAKVWLIRLKAPFASRNDRRS